MTNYWVLSSYSLDNIRRAHERLIWGFTDPTIKKEEKYAKNWRDFIKLYNKISFGDIMAFQLFQEGRFYIHGLGVVQEKFYDDETPIWDDEVKYRRVLYPWKVRFGLMLYSESPITELAIPTHEYVTGYGIGKLPRGDLETIIQSLEKTTGLKVKFI
ncbi:MAG: hypothetical protein QXR39_06790 [Candidatus Methanomethylicia archaeon]